MATDLPHYDLALDEMSVALSYVLMSSGATIPAPAAGKGGGGGKGKGKGGGKKKEKKEKKKEEDDDDFDVFGDDDDEEEEKPKESRAEMLARLKKEAEERTARKEAKQRTLVAIEVKPWSTEQDLKELWKKITTEIKQDGLKWGEGCNLVEVAFGIKKLCMTFTMGVNNSSDDVVEEIQGFEDDVQSVEVTSMNVL